MPAMASNSSPATASPERASRRLSSSTEGDDQEAPAAPLGGLGGLTLTSAIAIAAAAVAALLVFVVCVCCARCRRKRKAARRKHHDPMLFYAETSEYKGDSTEYYGTTEIQQPRWQGLAAATSPMNWHAVPPPPPDVDSSAFMAHGRPPVVPPPPPPVAAGTDKNAFSLEELVAATGGFSEANLLGQGGFGYVHKGVLPGGKEVAVKQLKAGSGQGEREFQAEVDMISRVKHRHLVALVGYCIAGAQRLLVYEFVPNGTLDHHLHGKGLPAMEWTVRLRIALGSAKGLAYLHEECNPRIIHRDIKGANILLDDDFEAMVADFGLAKLRNEKDTHVSTRVMGTFGYLAPEYASSGKLTEKSDVFSYGVMLLELLTGRRPSERSSYGEDGLVDWARPALSEALIDGNYDGLVDPRLNGDYDHAEAARVIASAAACIRHVARRRPKMSQIVKALQADVPLEELNDGVRPGHSSLFSTSSISGSEYGRRGSVSSSSYTVHMERIRKVALSSPEYSDEYRVFDRPARARSSSGSSVDDKQASDDDRDSVTSRPRQAHRQM